MNNRDFNAYLKFGRKQIRYGGPPPLPIMLPRGQLFTRKAFDRFDSRGKMPTNCKQPRVLRAVMYGKLSLNFHITDLWGHSLILTAKEAGAWLAIAELVELHEAFDYLPPWVWRTLVSKIRKAAPYWTGTPASIQQMIQD